MSGIALNLEFLIHKGFDVLGQAPALACFTASNHTLVGRRFT